jgi:hypothetical protein
MPIFSQAQVHPENISRANHCTSLTRGCRDTTGTMNLELDIICPVHGFRAELNIWGAVTSE